MSVRLPIAAPGLIDRNRSVVPVLPFWRYQLDPTHELAADLRFYILCAGNVAYDFVTGSFGTVSGMPTNGMERATNDGRCSHIPSASGTYFDFGHRAEWSLLGAMSLFGRGVLDSNPGGTTSRAVVTKAATDAGANSPFIFDMPGDLRLICVDASNFVIMRGQTPSTGVTQSWGIAMPSNPQNCRFYLNGSGQAGSVQYGSLATPATDSAQPLYVGRCRYTSNPIQWDGGLNIVAGWARQLGDIEQLRMHNQPYGLLRPRVMRAGFVGTSPPPPPPPTSKLFRPANYNGLGGGGPFFADPLAAFPEVR